MDKSKFGTMVNSIKPDKEAEELEALIKKAEANRENMNISLPPDVFNRLSQVAEFQGYADVQSYCVAVLSKSLETKVGAPSISSPGGKKQMITGPSKAFLERKG